MANRRVKNKKTKGMYKYIVTGILLIVIAWILNIAPNYVRDNIGDKVSLVINNNNVTKKLKNDVLIENDVIYISEDDIENYFDGEIHYDSQYDQIITSSDTKVAALPINSKTIEINSSRVTVYAGAMKKDDKYYLPFSEISKNVYNIETTYIKDTNTVVAVSLDRELVYANSSKKNKVKYKPTAFSKNVDVIQRGDNVTVVKKQDNEKVPDGWTKVTTENGKIGYVKSNTLVNSQTMRNDLQIEKQIEGNISIVWDYINYSFPNRNGKIEGVNVVSPTLISLKKLGKGELDTRLGTNAVNYVTWAHNNGYKVWVLASNESMKDTTSEIVNDYKLREKFINNVIDIVVKYNFDGVNLDFENIKMSDKDAYSRLIIELAPRLKELGKVLSVDVTAPDGSEDWSLCFDRNKIAKVADYIVFMGYDQHGTSSSEPGTVAGYNWVETNIGKFIDREEIDPDKIILGMPFYTRIWSVQGDEFSSKIVFMDETYDSLPTNTKTTWLETEKQNYAEYTKGNTTYKVWIEDLDSIKEKLNLVSKYKLAGAAYWRKDMESEKVWDIISEKLNIK